MSRPLAYYRVNVAGLVNVLNAMLRYDARTIVFSSSCATNVIPDRLPYGECAAKIHMDAPSSLVSRFSQTRSAQRGCASAISTPLARIRRGNWSSATTRRLI